MMHKPILIKNLYLSFPHKTCFDDFSVQISYGSRIAIIGRNGSGKSTLLKMIAGFLEPHEGTITHRNDMTVGYVPQILQNHTHLSGGERLNQAVTEALSLNPNVLLLDEPTNHLDLRNRKNLMRMLQHYTGTLIVVSHDKELLRQCTDTLWHIDNGKVHLFSGNYDDYMREIQLKRTSIENELEILNRQKEDIHHKLMREQQRFSKSNAKGKKSILHRKWPTVVSQANASRAEETSGRKKSAIDKRKSDLNTNLKNLRLPEMIVPKFSLEGYDVGRCFVVHISDASVGYFKNRPILSKITLNLQSGQRIAITGNNGRGKSTLIKAILGDESVHKTGHWYTIKRDDIGYLDQHYSTLNPHKTVLETIVNLMPHWPYTEIRRHLNDFLFRKNEEVNALVSVLSGGEKARLSLAQIAAKPPKLLILDEITNNLDLETKEHVIHVLKNYPGAIIVISHEDAFLKAIGVNEVVDVEKFK